MTNQPLNTITPVRNAAPSLAPAPTGTAIDTPSPTGPTGATR